VLNSGVEIQFNLPSKWVAF